HPKEGDTVAELYARVQAVHKQAALATEKELGEKLPKEVLDRIAELRDHSKHISSWHSAGVGLSLAEASLNMRLGRRQKADDDHVLPVVIASREKHEERFRELEEARQEVVSRLLRRGLGKMLEKDFISGKYVLSPKTVDEVRKIPRQGIETYSKAVESE